MQTYGADLRYNQHIHSIVNEGGFDKKKNGMHVNFIRYNAWGKKWQSKLLTRLKKENVDTQRDKQSHRQAFEKLYNEVVQFPDNIKDDRIKMSILVYLSLVMRFFTFYACFVFFVHFIHCKQTCFTYAFCLICAVWFFKVWYADCRFVQKDTFT